MKNFTLTVNETELEKLHQIYKHHIVKNDNPHLLFLAVHNYINISVYKTGKVVLQGEDVSMELIAIKQALGRVDYEAMGSDEVGTGDVFGPIIVCCAYTTLDDIKFLESLNVRDSKNMNDQRIIDIAPIIAKQLTHSLLILTPDKYNDLVQNGYNLNKIKAYLHNQAIVKTGAKINHEVPVIVDQFCTPQLYFNYLKDESLVYRKINFHPKAESVHLSVAAAAIIARYAFLVKIDQYSKKIGFDLLKGASKEVDELILKIHRKYKAKGLRLVAKMNYKNITKQNLT